jgi:hypothetical protein
VIEDVGADVRADDPSWVEPAGPPALSPRPPVPSSGTTLPLSRAGAASNLLSGIDLTLAEGFRTLLLAVRPPAFFFAAAGPTDPMFTSAAAANKRAPISSAAPID